MSVVAVLALCVALRLVVVGVVLVVGLGHAVHRCPALGVPVRVSIAAAGVLVAAADGGAYDTTVPRRAIE
ncbi:hypothetical protein [Streptomyces galbus]|uniref:Secreted protein n=1 Tax=Streptomyces galbus TaxID=33898 RepID=A0ABX1ITM8_STRGB|nr:hypothetical protein [Streptomyces galbus]NKQ28984.1 hypothetical protein [Streptomyces galbus]